jgi:hypothetical protein
MGVQSAPKTSAEAYAKAATSSGDAKAAFLAEAKRLAAQEATAAAVVASSSSTGTQAAAGDRKQLGWGIYQDPSWKALAGEKPTPYPSQKEFEAVFIYEPYLADQSKAWLAERNKLIGEAKSFFSDWDRYSGDTFYNRQETFIRTANARRFKSDADKTQLESRLQAALRAIGQPYSYQGYIIVPRAKAEGKIVFDVAAPTINDTLASGFDNKDDAQAKVNELIAKQAGAQASQVQQEQQRTIPGTDGTVAKAPMSTGAKVAIVGGGAAAALFAIMANR